MAKRNGRRNGNGGGRAGTAIPAARTAGGQERLHPDTKKSIWALSFTAAAVILSLSGFGEAGPAGTLIYRGLDALLGWGYFILPATLLFAAAVFFLSAQKRLVGTTLAGSGLLILSFLGLIDIFSPAHGGLLGLVLGSLRYPFGEIAAAIMNAFVLAIAVLVTANVPLRFRFMKRRAETAPYGTEEREPEGSPDGNPQPEKEKEPEEEMAEKGGKNAAKGKEGGAAAGAVVAAGPKDAKPSAPAKAPVFANYVPPPLSLLKAEIGKPTTGDLLANANVIKRTLESFGISVDMGEINVGPAVTRYTLKPAEGVKLSRITALNSDLALALAAHPIRIEAPIPGKSLVGIEVPNKAAALVRLGSLMNYPEFQQSGPLGFIVGRDVSGEPVFANIEKMPHMLVAGATGSGKSILVHSLITSLLYKNSPQTLRLVMIDPKRVELSVYDGIPHLVSPVITENKKALGVFRWAISEMDRRYDLLQKAGSRDIKSYNAGHKDEALPYLLIVVDEMADLMTSFGRDVEGSIVRLAQMARATGIHLLLATQRPSVEVITGLIKANITARVALQVASQIDSRTILDAAGAEKLLGHGDLLFLSAELSKPKRIQGAFVTEEEIRNVADFIRAHNKPEPPASGSSGAPAGDGAEGIAPGGAPDMFATAAGGAPAPGNFDEYLEDEDSDELFDEALAIVAEAKKASASLLQRRLKVGYARAARLLDLMEGAELIGPGEGAKPRDVYLEKIESHLS